VAYISLTGSLFFTLPGASEGMRVTRRCRANQLELSEAAERVKLGCLVRLRCPGWPQTERFRVDDAICWSLESHWGASGSPATTQREGAQTSPRSPQALWGPIGATARARIVGWPRDEPKLHATRSAVGALVALSLERVGVPLVFFGIAGCLIKLRKPPNTRFRGHLL